MNTPEEIIKSMSSQVDAAWRAANQRRYNDSRDYIASAQAHVKILRELMKPEPWYKKIWRKIENITRL